MPAAAAASSSTGLESMAYDELLDRKAALEGEMFDLISREDLPLFSSDDDLIKKALQAEARKIESLLTAKAAELLGPETSAEDGRSVFLSGTSRDEERNPAVQVLDASDDGFSVVSSRKRRRPNPTCEDSQGPSHPIPPVVPVLFRSSEGSKTLGRVNPSLLSDVLQMKAGRLLSSRLLSDKELLVKVATIAQADQLLTITCFGDAHVEARLAETFAHPSGVIAGINPHLTEEALLEALRSFRATKVRRQTYVVDGGLRRNTGKIVVTFAAHPLPLSVRVGDDMHRVVPYVSSPEHCGKCRRWGHRGEVCRNSARCGKCAGSHPTGKCPSPLDIRCANCRQPHPADFLTCPVRLQAIKQRRSVILTGQTWKEARQTVAAQPSVASKKGKRGTFADVVANRPSTEVEEVVATTNARDPVVSDSSVVVGNVVDVVQPAQTKSSEKARRKRKPRRRRRKPVTLTANPDPAAVPMQCSEASVPTPPTEAMVLAPIQPSSMEEEERTDVTRAPSVDEAVTEIAAILTNCCGLTSVEGPPSDVQSGTNVAIASLVSLLVRAVVGLMQNPGEQSPAMRLLDFASSLHF